MGVTREFSSRRDSPVMVRLLREIVAATEASQPSGRRRRLPWGRFGTALGQLGGAVAQVTTPLKRAVQRGKAAKRAFRPVLKPAGQKVASATKATRYAAQATYPRGPGENRRRLTSQRLT